MMTVCILVFSLSVFSMCCAFLFFEASRCVHRCEGLSVLSESEAEQQRLPVLGGLLRRAACGKELGNRGKLAGFTVLDRTVREQTVPVLGFV